MNIYVDELPKGCDSCPLLSHSRVKISSTKYVDTKSCILGDFYKYSSIDDEVDNCPLKLLENAIVPKFKIKQEVYFILWDGQLAVGNILAIHYSKFPYKDEENPSGILYDIRFDDGHESDSEIFEERLVFATKEEAEAKLKEMIKSE